MSTRVGRKDGSSKKRRILWKTLHAYDLTGRPAEARRLGGGQRPVELLRATLRFFREQSFFLESAVMPELPVALRRQLLRLDADKAP